jgi:hypothetical protein
MKILLSVFGLLFVNNIYAQNVKQILDTRIKGINSLEECKKVEEQVLKNKDIIKCYSVFKGPENKATKLVVEINIKETGENDQLFCSEDLKRILVNNGYELLSVKEITLNKNEVYPNYDK